MRKLNKKRELRLLRKKWRRHLRAAWARREEARKRHEESWNDDPGAEVGRLRRRAGVPRIRGARR